jgi:hypothetical protein
MSGFYATTVMVSAALVFAVQPLMARMLLPRLGGAPAVWNTCLVFFQAALLVGYGYVHWLSRRRDVRRQTRWHLTLLVSATLLAPLVLLPLAIDSGWTPAEYPIAAVLGVLTLSVGLPLAALSATAPLLQSWYAACQPGRNPYALYAASNLGSIGALLAYPFLIEPNLSLWWQGVGWAAGFAVLALLVVRCALAAGKSSLKAVETLASDAPAIEPKTRLYWLVLAFVPASLLYGTTTYLTTDVAAIPLLWILPLVLYLLSFILAFARPPASRHARIFQFFPLAVLSAPFVFVIHRPVSLAFVLHLGILFVVALACHGELARRRPVPAQLTDFYLWLAVGGVLGGAFNALFAPLLFVGLVEYPLALVLACLVVPPEEEPTGRLLNWNDIGIPLMLFLVLSSLGPVLRVQLRDEPAELRLLVLAMVLYGLPAAFAYFFRGRPVRFGLCVGALLLGTAAAGGLASSGGVRNTTHEERSFFGVIRVVDVTDPDDAEFHLRQFVHGSTIHGLERRSEDPALRRESLSYYARTGPIGDVFASRAGRLRSIGVLGLGAGALAVYADAEQEWTYYEIDPAVARVAEEYFHCLGDARNRGVSVDIVLGDGRLSLGKSADKRFDLLFADAFSSDAVPVHLLTREALALYRARLADGGLLIVNVTNRYLDLEPVLADLAADAGIAARIAEEIDLPAEETKRGKSPSRWIVLAETESGLASLAESRWRPLRKGSGKVWRDDYSNLVGALK